MNGGTASWEECKACDGTGSIPWGEYHGSGVAESIINEFKMKPTPKSKQGMFKNTTKAEARKELTAVKAKMKAHEEKGEKVPAALRTKFSQLTFNLRAKNDWGKVDETNEGFLGFGNKNKTTTPSPKQFSYGQKIRYGVQDGVVIGKGKEPNCWKIEVPSKSGGYTTTEANGRDLMDRK